MAEASPYKSHTISHYGSFLLIIFTILIVTIINPSNSTEVDTFIYVGCSQIKYPSNTQYESNVNSMLTSFINSATYSAFNKYTLSPNTPNVLYGLYQCRPDLSKTDCAQCVQRSVSQLGTLCSNSCGGVIQLDGCFVKYDNSSFLGVEDKTVVDRKCGPVEDGGNSEMMNHLDDILDYLGSAGDYYRVWKSGNVRGVAECTGDLSADECEDCVTEAVELLRSNCQLADWGDMFLGKCYARYSIGGGGGSSSNGDSGGSGVGYHEPYSESGSDHDDKEVDKTIATIIALIAGIALLIIFLTFLRKSREENDDK